MGQLRCPMLLQEFREIQVEVDPEVPMENAETQGQWDHKDPREI